MQIDAVEIVPRLLGRDCELGLVDQPLEIGGRKREGVRHLAGGEVGKVALGQGLQGEPGAAGANRQHGAVAGGLDHDLRALRQLAKERNMNLAEFGKLAEKDPSVDRMIDERQKEIGESRDDIVIEGRLAGWMISNADLRIWVLASQSCRAERIAEREGLDPETAFALTLEREICEAGRYMEYYDIDITDLSAYDLVISSEKWGRTELAAVVDRALELL